jgi:hypothetical protein
MPFCLCVPPLPRVHPYEIIGHIPNGEFTWQGGSSISPLQHKLADKERAPLMFIIGLVMGLILGLTLSLIAFALFLLQLVKQQESRKRASSVDRYA